MTYKDLPLIIVIIALVIIGLTFMITEKEEGNQVDYLIGGEDTVIHQPVDVK
ncbi:MAG: hypothetical protein ACOCTT_02215 [archaeon]